LEDKLGLIDEVNKSVQEEKDRRNSIENKAYFGGMFASFLMVVTICAVVDAFDGNLFAWIFLGIPSAIVSLPIYWGVSSFLNIKLEEQKWWHLPACLLAVGVVLKLITGTWN
jgi:hypothetical protein